MGDSELSASQLRQRYHRGGSAKDDELTAQQLRARHGIPSNNQDFSSSKGEGQSANMGLIIGILVVVVIAGGAAFYVLNQ